MLPGKKASSIIFGMDQEALLTDMKASAKFDTRRRGKPTKSPWDDCSRGKIFSEYMDIIAFRRF